MSVPALAPCDVACTGHLVAVTFAVAGSMRMSNPGSKGSSGDIASLYREYSLGASPRSNHAT